MSGSDSDTRPAVKIDIDVTNVTGELASLTALPQGVVDLIRDEVLRRVCGDGCCVYPNRRPYWAQNTPSRNSYADASTDSD